MKKKISIFVFVLTILFCIRPVFAEVTVYKTIISFHANGGEGSMQNQTVTLGVPANLTKNQFTRTDFEFTGWNTRADGQGIFFADASDASQFASLENNGKTVTLYAQWKINAPKIKKITSKKPGMLNVTFTQNSHADGYEVQYSINKNFTGAKTVKLKKGVSKWESSDLIPGKNYYIRIRSYSETTKAYGDFSGAKKKKVKKGWTIVNAKSYAAIEADVTLSGSGTGYHAKFVVGTATSAVSYGMQYDRHAVAPYTGKTMALIENVASNNAGGQRYSRPGNKSLKLKKSYHLMMTIDKRGKGAVYLDYKKIGSFSNPSLAKKDVYLRIEASARLNGDSVKAVFKNVKLKKGNKYNPDRNWGIQEFKLNKTLKGKRKNNTFTLYGRISGLPAGGDWDSCYESVSEIVQFN